MLWEIRGKGRFLKEKKNFEEEVAFQINFANECDSLPKGGEKTTR